MATINATTHVVTIPPNDEVKLSCAGRFFSCKDADGEFFLEYDEGGSLAFEGSMWHTPEVDFKAVRLVNKSDSPIKAKVLIADGPIGDGRSSFSSTDPIPVQIQSESQAANASVARIRIIDGAAPVQIAAENAYRRHLSFQNTGAANVWVWIDGVRARMLAPFDDWTFYGRDAVSASADSGDGFISSVEV